MKMFNSLVARFKRMRKVNTRSSMKTVFTRWKEVKECYDLNIVRLHDNVVEAHVLINDACGQSLLKWGSSQRFATSSNRLWLYPRWVYGSDEFSLGIEYLDENEKTVFVGILNNMGDWPMSLPLAEELVIIMEDLSTESIVMGWEVTQLNKKGRELINFE